MYWSALHLSAEYFLGTFHVVSRARRVDFDRTHGWDDLYRGVIYPPHDMSDTDMPWHVLSRVAADLRPIYAENGPQGGSQPEMRPAPVLGYVNHI